MTKADATEFNNMKLAVTCKVPYSWVEQFLGFCIR